MAFDNRTIRYGWAAGEKPASKRVIGAVYLGESFVQIFGAKNRHDGTKNFLTSDDMIWLHIGENSRRHEIIFCRGGSLPGEMGFN